MLSAKTQSDTLLTPRPARSQSWRTLALDGASSSQESAKTAQERRAEALTRACTGQTLSNYPAIFQGFMAMGIPESDIRPRENVFTYEAWKALGRHVRKGQHGVKVVTFIACESKGRTDGQTDATESPENPSQARRAKKYSRPWTTTVFHVSQTDPDEMPSAISA